MLPVIRHLRISNVTVLICITDCSRDKWTLLVDYS